MSRSALAVGEAVGPEAALTPVLQAFDIQGLTSVPDVAAALPLVSLGHIDIVFVAVDQLTESSLAQLDRTVRTSPRTEVVGTAPDATPEFMLKAMRAGIQEFLVRPLRTEDLTSALERVSRRHAAAVAGQLIACYAAKGGTGVSSVAANLAYAMAHGNKTRRVSIVDFVLPNGEQRLQFNINPAYDIRDVATKPERVDQELLNSVMPRVRDGLWLLASSEDPDVDDLLDATMTSTIIAQLRLSYHYTVVDCDRQLDDRTLAVLDIADRILLVTQLNVSALRATQRTLSIFRRLGYPEEKLNVIVNRFQSGEVISVSDASEVLKTEVYFKLPNDYKAMVEAASRGVPVAEVEANSKLSLAYTTLAQRITGSPERNGASKNGKSDRKLLGIFSRKK